MSAKKKTSKKTKKTLVSSWIVWVLAIILASVGGVYIPETRPVLLIVATIVGVMLIRRVYNPPKVVNDNYVPERLRDAQSNAKKHKNSKNDKINDSNAVDMMHGVGLGLLFCTLAFFGLLFLPVFLLVLVITIGTISNYSKKGRNYVVSGISTVIVLFLLVFGSCVVSLSNMHGSYMPTIGDRGVTR